MKIGIIGSGRVGGNAGRHLTRAGHEVLFSFARDAGKLARVAAEAGPAARTGTPREAAAFGEVVLLAVPWPVIDEALAAAGSLAGKIVIDTTNPFGAGEVLTLPDGVTASVANARRLPGARLVKAFNTLTAGFQAAVGDGKVAEPVAMFYAGADAAAKRTAAPLIADCGFEPVDLGGWNEGAILEAPRRPGAVYGEAYTPAAARRIAAAVRDDPAAAARLADTLKLPD